MAGWAEFEVVPVGGIVELTSIDDAADDAVWVSLLNAVPVCAPP